MTTKVDVQISGVTNLETQLGKNVIDHALKTWINPELEKRKLNGTLGTSFQLSMAQIIINVDTPFEVRINEQVQMIAKVRAKRAIEKGEFVIGGADFDEVHDLALTEADPNAAHISMIFFNGQWLVAFDFRYNTDRVLKHLAAAQEFIDTAEFCLTNQKYRAFNENLFAAIELTAKSWLLNMPIPQLLKPGSHGFIHSKINAHSHLGNVEQKYAQLYNQLSAQRGEARYLNRTFAPNPQEYVERLAVGKAMIEDVRKFSLRDNKQQQSNA